MASTALTLSQMRATEEVEGNFSIWIASWANMRNTPFTDPEIYTVTMI